MSQLAEIRAHLEAGAPLTPIGALAEYGCFRLGARIHELRREGLAIETELVELREKRFARYTLVTPDGGDA